MTSPDGTPPTHRAAGAMDDMETTITEMQGSIAETLAPVRRHFRPWWLVMALLVAVLTGGGGYLGVTMLTDTTEAIDRNCEVRNAQLKVINQKFDQLNVLFDAALAEPRAPDEPPPSEKILRLYQAFKRPIPLTLCKTLSSVIQGAPR